VAVRVRVQIAEAEVHRLLLGPTGLATKYVMRKTDQILNRARLYCPVDTGNLRASLTTAIRTQGNTVTGLVGSDVEYALPLHQGRVTSRGRKIPGRPFLRKALTDVMGGGG
jgi:phage gpG-like protein